MDATMRKRLRSVRPRGPEMIGQIPLGNVFLKSEFLVRCNISPETFAEWVDAGLPVVTRNKKTYISAAAWWNWMINDQAFASVHS